MLKHVVTSPEDGLYVTAMMSLGDAVFVLYGSGGHRLKVYDANTFKFRSYITIPGIHSFGCLPAWDYFGCLYVTDGFKSIYRVDLRMLGRKTMKTFNVAYTPSSMLVNNAHNLTVAGGVVNKIHECTAQHTVLL